MAEADLGNLSVYLRARFDKLEEDMRSARAATERAQRDMQRSMDHIGRASEQAARQMSTMRDVAIGLSGIIGGVLSVHFLALGAEIVSTSRTLGISAQRLQEYRVAAELAGASSEGVTQALQFFSRQLGDTTNEMTPFRTALNQLGLRWADIRNMGMDRALLTVQDALSRVTDQTRVLNIANELFSRGSRSTITFLTQSGHAMAEATEEARKLGIVISNEVVAKANRANDEWTLLTTALRASAITISAELLKVMIRLKEAVTDPAFQDGVKELARRFGELVTVIAQNKEAILTVIGALTGAAILGVLGPWGRVVGAIGGGVGAMTMFGHATDTVLTNMQGEANQLTTTLDNLRTVATGGLTAAAAQASLATGFWTKDAARKEIERLEVELTALNVRIWQHIAARQTLRQAPPLSEAGHGAAGHGAATTPTVHFEAIDKAIEGLELRRKLLAQELPGLAEQFADTLKAMNLPGVEAFRTATAGAAALTGQFKALNEALVANQAVQIGLSLRTETEVLQQELTTRLALIEVYEKSRQGAEGRGAAIRERLVHDSNLKILQAQARTYTALANVVDTSMNQISDLIGQSGDKQFFIFKAISMAVAAVKGYEAVLGAYAAGNVVGGPVVGYAFAAIAAAGVAAQIAKLAGLGPSSTASDPGMASAGGGAAATEAAVAENKQQQSVNIHLVGQVFGRDQVLMLIKEINKATRDGAHVRVAA